MVEQKLLGTYRLAVLEMENPKKVFFVKNSGEFYMGQKLGEIVVSTDKRVFAAMGIS